VYNHHLVQRNLGHSTPIQAMKVWYRKQPELFKKRVFDHSGLDSYAIQQAHYSAVYRHIAGHDPAAFVFLAVEKTPPYAIGIYQLPESLLMRAQTDWRAALNFWAECTASSQYPGYGNDDLMTVIDFYSK